MRPPLPSNRMSLAKERTTAPRLPGTRERVSFQFDPTGVAVPQQLQLARAGSDAAVRVIVQASGQVQVDAGAR